MSPTDANSAGVNQLRRQQWLPPVLLLTVCAFLFYDLGYIGLTSPDEARYSEVAREMLAGSGWVVPHLNAEPRINKPPLTYWLLAASYRLFGLHEWAGRLVSALAALGAVLLTVAWGASVLGLTAGCMAGVVTASSIFYFILARLTTPDMLLCFFFTGAVVSGLWGMQCDKRNVLGVIGFFVFAAAGTLTKGPVALLLPGLIILCACAWEKRWQQVFGPAVFIGVFLYALLVAPWFVLLERTIPHAALAFLFRENITRFSVGVDHTHSSFLYYVPILILGVLPWAALAPAALWQGIRDATSSYSTEGARSLVRGAILWWLVPFVFFTASATRLAPYILPCFPALGLLIGNALAREMVSAGSERHARWTWMTTQGLLLPILAVAGSVMLVRENALTTREAMGLSVGVLAAGMAGGIMTVAAAWRRGPAFGVPVLLAAHYYFIASAMHVHAALEPYEELRPVAMRLRALGESTSPLVCYAHYKPAMSFYLGKVIPTVKWKRLAHLICKQKRVLCVVDRNREGDITHNGVWVVHRVAGNNDISVLEVVSGSVPSTSSAIQSRCLVQNEHHSHQRSVSKEVLP